jgi:hypothetical protein
VQRKNPSRGCSYNRSVAAVRRVVSRRYGCTQVVFVVAATFCYEILRRMLRPDWPLAVGHAREVFGWERQAHLAWEAPLQRAFLRIPGLVEGLNVFYLAGNLIVTACFFLWLYRRSQKGFRLFRNAFLIATVISLLIEWRFPTAPPRLAGIGVEDTLRRLSGIDIGSPGSGALTDPVAALPSLHAGWALGVGAGIVAYANGALVRAAGVAYTVAVDATVIVTGNHFVFDTIAGMGLVIVCLGLVAVTDRLEMVKSPIRRGVEQSGSSPGS